MAELKFEIQTGPWQVSAITYKNAISHAVGLLNEFDAAISGRPRGILSWYVGKLHSNGSLFVTFVPKVRTRRKRDAAKLHDISPAVTGSLVGGFEEIEKCSTPPLWSEFGLQRADELTRLIGKNGATGFRFEALERSVAVTEKTAENLGKLLPIRRTAIGSVEGKLEGINLHGKPRFIVYHAITNKAVNCLFSPDTETIGQVKDCLGRRVVVFGTLHKNISGDTLRITVERLAAVDDSTRFTVPNIATLPEPDFAKTESTKEYMRRIRGGR